jgi:medium-chain acyl-[acyl-carrier-protein] hydrolase
MSNSYSDTIPDPSDSTPWYVCSHIHASAKKRLFFFPYAGGGPSVFGKWLGKLPSYAEGYIAHYPGRGSRYQEPPINQLPVLVERLYQAIQSLLDKPFAFFGHSLGGLVAFELARQLRQQNLPQPQVLFVSACGAPHLPDSHPRIHTLRDDEFLESLQQLNGIPSEILHQADLMQLLLPMLRADFQAIENYVFTNDQPSLDCPIVAFGGLDDPRLSREYIEGWVLHTSSSFKSQYFPGDHFFINTATDTIIESIIAEIESSYRAKG